MTQHRKNYYGTWYVRTSAGVWYLVFERAACLCINRHGTQYWRSGSEVWKDISISLRTTLENDFVRDTRASFERVSLKYDHWGKVVRTMILGAGKNEHLHDLASMIESLRQTHYGQYQQELRTTLDEIAVQTRASL